MKKETKKKINDFEEMLADLEIVKADPLAMNEEV